MRFLEESNSYRQKVEWWFPGTKERGMGRGRCGKCLTGTEFQSGKIKQLWRWMVVMAI